MTHRALNESLAGMTNIKITHQHLPPSVGSRWNKLHSPEAWLMTAMFKSSNSLEGERHSVRVCVCVCAGVYTHLQCAHACTCPHWTNL